MKRITLFFALLMGLGLTSLQAQSCQKSASACCKKSASVAKADKSHVDGSADAAAKLASLDESVEAQKCEKSGEVNYVRKEVDPETGKVVLTSLEYNSELGKFVNSTEKKACCTGDKMKCCSSKTKVTESSKGEKASDVKQTKYQKGS